MLKLDTVDSTNNYAMRIIDADKAEHGLTILAGSQTEGKGQRGRVWQDHPGQSLLMSTILKPVFELNEQPLFLAAIAVAVAGVINTAIRPAQASIKWPNDIILGDKKAGGILIENVVRGTGWNWAVVGIGLNLNQAVFPEDLPFATSLYAETSASYDREDLAGRIQAALMSITRDAPDAILKKYNGCLYRAGNTQRFSKETGAWEARIVGMNHDGRLEVLVPGSGIQQYAHGSVEWVWS